MEIIHPFKYFEKLGGQDEIRSSRKPKQVTHQEEKMREKTSNLH